MKKLIALVTMVSLGGNALFSMEAEKKQETQAIKEDRKEFFLYLSLLPKELRQKALSLSLQSEVGGRYDVMNSIAMESPFLSVAFSPDGKALLTGSEDGAARLWDIETGKQLKEFSGHAGYVLSVAVSPDGKTIATGSDDCTVRLWDRETGEQLKQFSGHTEWIFSVAFSPDGKTIATVSGESVGSGGGTARLWDVEEEKELMVFGGYQNLSSKKFFVSIAFSPDGRTILTGSCSYSPCITASKNCCACLWDVKSGQQLLQFAGYGGTVTSVAFSPDGKTILTGSEDGAARLWDRETGEQLKIFWHNKGLLSVAFSPDGKTILTGSDNEATLWNVEKEIKLQIFNISAQEVAFNFDGSLIALGSTGQTLSLGKYTLAWTPEQEKEAYKIFLEKGFHKILQEAPQVD